MNQSHPVDLGASRRSRRGLSYLEVLAVVSVVATLTAIFVPTFARHLRTSKTSEAPEMLADLYRRSAAYFVIDRPLDEEGSPERSACLPGSAGPSPRQPDADPVGVDFGEEAAPSGPTWSALGFGQRAPYCQPEDDGFECQVRYSYTFEPAGSGCGLHSPTGSYLLSIRAEGDLDGDGERSVFERRATADEGGQLVPFGVLYTRDRME